MSAAKVAAPKWVEAFSAGQAVETRIYVGTAICWVRGRLTHFHRDGKPVIRLDSDSTRDVHVLLGSDIRAVWG